MYKEVFFKGKGKSYKMSNWLKIDVKISPCLEPTACDRSAIFICQKLTTCNIFAVVMGGVF
jgi:hypothetical protein